MVSGMPTGAAYASVRDSRYHLLVAPTLALRALRDSALPVGLSGGRIQNGSFDLDACVGHVPSAAGTDCRENGCLARRACPIGPEFRYPPAQARFHMSAFLDDCGR